MKKAISVISMIVGVVLLVGIAFGIYVLFEATNNFKTRPTAFWLTVDGQRYCVDSDIELTEKSVAVNYLIDWLSRKQGYTYKIVPVGEDFVFEVDGILRNWLEQDLTPVFDVTEYDNGFIISNQKTLQELLQELYPEQTVKVYAPKYMCKLQVISIDGDTIELTFRGRVALNNIKLNSPSIVF